MFIYVCCVKIECNMVYVVFDCTAVRENRMPGGMPRLKKVRINSTDEAMDVETVVTGTEKDTNELMLCQVLDARPDIMPLREGKKHH